MTPSATAADPALEAAPDTNAALAAALRTLTRIADSLTNPILAPDGSPLSAAHIAQARLAALAIVRLLKPSSPLGGGGWDRRPACHA